MDNQDEFYRQLRDADREQAAANRGLRRLVTRWLDGRTDGLSHEQKAAVLAVREGLLEDTVNGSDVKR